MVQAQCGKCRLYITAAAFINSVIQMYTFLQEFVLGTNQTGYLAPGATSVVGGVHTEYLKGVLTGSEIYTGSGVTQGTYTWPSSVWNAWGSYMATRTAADVPVASAPGDAVFPSASQGGSPRLLPSMASVILLATCVLLATYH